MSACALLDRGYRELVYKHKGKVLISKIDTDDFDMASRLKTRITWCGVNGKRVPYVYIVFPDGSSASLARLILNCQKGFEPDHIHHDTLDNRRVELRSVTRRENLNNRRKFTCGAAKISQYVGVSWFSRDLCWQVTGCVPNLNGGSSKNKFIGFFKDEKEAAVAWDDFARKHIGKMAYLNFPGPGENGRREEDCEAVRD